MGEVEERFKIIDRKPIDGKLIYLNDDGGFAFEPNDRNALDEPAGSILLNGIYIVINSECKLQYLDGECPHGGWEKQDLIAPDYISKSIVVNLSDYLHEGDKPEFSFVVYSFDGFENSFDEPWTEYIDYKSGWICIGNPEPEGDYKAVEFATGCVIVLQDSKLVSLWLKPVNMPDEHSKRKNANKDLSAEEMARNIDVDSLKAAPWVESKMKDLGNLSNIKVMNKKTRFKEMPIGIKTVFVIFVFMLCQEVFGLLRFWTVTDYVILNSNGMSYLFFVLSGIGIVLNALTLKHMKSPNEAGLITGLLYCAVVIGTGLFVMHMITGDLETSKNAYLESRKVRGMSTPGEDELGMIFSQSGQYIMTSIVMSISMIPGLLLVLNRRYFKKEPFIVMS